MKLKEAQKIHSCPHCLKKHYKNKGYYYRKISKTYIPRYFCYACKKNFSTRTTSKTFKQKRPDLNLPIYKSLTSGITLRRTAANLNCDYKTVYRKFLWLSELAKTHHLSQVFELKELQFDEMESIEHTKLKPLTIAMAVSDDYKILNARVGSIPAKGLLAKISVNKYGPRLNESDKVLRELLEITKPLIKTNNYLVKSDAKPSYKNLVKELLPDKLHETFVSSEHKEKKREAKYTNLEKRIFDPLFAVNQRMAKLRDHVKRLTRRSWCTTKKKENLESHLYLYIASNNGYSFF